MGIPVTITSPAILEIHRILDKKGIPSDYALRLGVKGGHGCAGVNFSLGFDKPKSDDYIYEIDGISVVIQKSVMLYLAGKKVDYYSGADAQGFVFVEDDQPEISTTAR